MRRWLAMSSLAAAMTTGGLAAQPLIGDPVPALREHVTWHRGEPTPKFELGRVYVLDFWATWCPPCLPLLGHLSEVQDRYRDRGLTVVGIALGTDLGMPLPRFLDQEGARITYPIAEPEDGEALKARLVHPWFMPCLRRALSPSRGAAETFREQASSAAKEQGWGHNYIRYISSVDLKLAIERQSTGPRSVCEGEEAT